MKKNLVVVAHPDDETIWMGGTILEKPHEQWTIVSLCRKEDPDRRPKFRRVCRKLKAKSIISDLDDENLEPLTVEEVAQKIKSIVPEEEYDNIYTHGNNGEYGHLRHKEIHRAVRKLVRDKDLKCNKLYSFSYRLGRKTTPKIPDLRIPIPRKADEHIELSEDNYKKKISLVKDTYGFEGESFEVLSCHNIEAFKKVL